MSTRENMLQCSVVARIGTLVLGWLCFIISTGALAQVANDSGSNPCGHKPTCTVSGQVNRYIWRPIRAPSTFTAFTVVTIINTVLDTTTTTTIMAELPDTDYAPPPTNSEGKRLQTLPYTDADGHETTTVVVFPTLFFDWDTEYKVSGEYVLTPPGGGEAECVRFGTTASTVVPITGDPQPAPPRNTDPALDPGDDILGWGYTMESDGGVGPGVLISLIDLLPEEQDLPHSVVANCGGTEIFPANNKFDASWMAVGAQSVSYVGDLFESVSALPTNNDHSPDLQSSIVMPVMTSAVAPGTAGDGFPSATWGAGGDYTGLPVQYTTVVGPDGTRTRTETRLVTAGTTSSSSSMLTGGWSKSRFPAWMLSNILVLMVCLAWYF